MLSDQLTQAVTIANGTPRKEVGALLAITKKVNPGWNSHQFAEKTAQAAQALKDLIGIEPSVYDSKRNRQKIWKLLMKGTLGVPIAIWQFICPPKIVLRGNTWVVEADPKYDILGPSVQQTERVYKLLKKSTLPFEITIYYPDDEILKARASGLAWEKLPNKKRNQLANQLDEISLEQCIYSQQRVGSSIDVMLWSEVGLQLEMDIDKMFRDELIFWKEQGQKGIGFFSDTQAWLVRTFAFPDELAYELTARRLAKYAVEGRILAQRYPWGSIYLNNEFPYKEPWAMFTASLTQQERETMAVLYYIKKGG